MVFPPSVFRKCKNIIITIIEERIEGKVVGNKKGIWNQRFLGSTLFSNPY